MSNWRRWTSSVASFVWNASGAGNVVQGAKEVYGNSATGGTWSGMAKGAGRMLLGGVTAYTLPQRGAYALGLKAVNWLASPTKATNRETVGPIVRGIGDRVRSQTISEQGRQLQYGHLSVDQYFTRHPDEFLKDYAVESIIQHPEHPGGQSRTHKTFQFRTVPRYSTLPEMGPITDSHGVMRQPKGHLHLLMSSQAEGHQHTFGSTQVGNEFQAAFLPMLQARDDHLRPPRGLGPHLSEMTVLGFNQGRVRDTNLRQRAQTITVTTQLSGCSVTSQRRALLHIRPHDSGQQLNQTLGTPNTFGRSDYGPGNTAFVMAKRGSNGGTTVHYQVHDQNTQMLRTGSKTFR